MGMKHVMCILLSLFHRFNENDLQHFTDFFFDYTNKTCPLELNIYCAMIKKSNIDKILHFNSTLNYPTHIFIPKFHCKFFIDKISNKVF